jgi:NAD(P)-dependent dehydrogenase (short-subunit alcohol dehydrogenase family)
MEKVAAEARACGEVNYVGTVLALACFVCSPLSPFNPQAQGQLPLLASTSKSPVLHHLSSVAATIAAPTRAIYSATKAAAFMAVESCRVECEGSGVRFFCKIPYVFGCDANDSTPTRDDSKWIPSKARSKQRRWSGRNTIRYPT